MANDKTLVIVESPAKAKKIAGYLGDDYVVMASVGHVRDLGAGGVGEDGGGQVAVAAVWWRILMR